MNGRLAWLVVAAAALGAYVLLQGPFHTPLGMFESGGKNDGAAPWVAPSASVLGQPAELNPLHGLVADRFRAIIERPLFNPGRAQRPIEPPAPPPAPPVEAQPTEATPPSRPNAEDFNLLAVSTGPKGRVAVLRIVASGEVLYLREGHLTETWTLLSVSDRSVVVGTAEHNVTISLFEVTAPASEETAVEGEAPTEQELSEPAPASAP